MSIAHERAIIFRKRYLTIYGNTLSISGADTWPAVNVLLGTEESPGYLV
jgi:hypothetical protein